MAELPLEELMHQAQQGNNSAYRKLLNACLPIIYKIVRQKVSNENVVEDVVQEVLVSLHQARHTYDPQKPFKPWLYSICRFRTVDALRKIYRTKDDIYTEDLSGEIEDGKKNVTDSIEDNELVNKMMNDLPEKQRNILLLMKVEGLTAAEVSVKTGMSISAVKVSAHRAMKSLKDKWGKHYGK